MKWTVNHSGDAGVAGVAVGRAVQKGKAGVLAAVVHVGVVRPELALGRVQAELVTLGWGVETLHVVEVGPNALPPGVAPDLRLAAGGRSL